MSIILNLLTRTTTHEGWGKTSQITGEDLKNMADPDGGQAKQMAVAIPTPFARMHLVETALKYVRDHPAETASIHHRLVGQLWDAWEIIFNYHLFERAGNKLLIRTWQREPELQALEASPATQPLAQVLRLFLEKQGADHPFDGFTDLHFFSWKRPDGTLYPLAATSPLTVLFPAPDLTEPLMQRSEGGGRYFDGLYIPLAAREPAFREYIYALWVGEPGFRARFPALGTALDDKIVQKLTQSTDPKPDLSTAYERLRDHAGNPVGIGALPLRARPDESVITSSDFFIVPNPTKVVADADPLKLPLVLKPGMRAPGKKYFNQKAWEDDTVVYPTDNQDNPGERPRTLSNRTLPGVGFKHPYLTINDFLEDTLLAVPYPVDEKRFLTGDLKTARDAPEAFGPLLPLRSTFFDYFTADDLKRLLKIEVTPLSVHVRLTIPTKGGEVEYERFYYENPQRDDAGRLRVTNVGLAIFPFVRVMDAPEYNDFYKVMLVDANNLDLRVVHQPVKLEFWHQGAAIPEVKDTRGTEKSVTRYDRTPKTGDDEGSAYYTVRGEHEVLDATGKPRKTGQDVAFEFIVVQHPGGGQSLAVPNWPKATQGAAKFRFAVDFGTTNTHVAYSDDTGTGPRAFGFGSADSPVGLLKKPFVRRDQHGQPLATQEQTPYERLLMGIDDDPAHYIQIKRWQTYLEREFVPPIIGAEGSPYAFPIRTAVSEAADFSAKTTELLGNVNIGFGMITEDPPSSSSSYTPTYVTNLKWTVGLGRTAEQVQAFFEELLLLFRAKVLLAKPAGKLADTHLTWFAPLSFSVPQRRLFQTAWDTAYQRIFHTTQTATEIAESTAPYYYLTATNAIFHGSTDTVAFIDIGGGTTDILLYANEKPVLNTSFRFAGTDLWGDGGAAIKRKENGLVRFGLDAFTPATFTPAARRAYTRVQAAFSNERYSSDDVASFLFAYDADLGFSRQMHHAQQLRVLFYLHFGAIVYHIGQLTQLYGLPVPRYLCLTGRGSLYVQLLRDGSDAATVTAAARRILEAVAGAVPTNFEIIFVPDPKQATANGGVLATTATRPTVPEARPIGVVPATEGRDADGKPLPHTLAPDAITPDVQQAVLTNVRACLDLLLTDRALVALLPDLGIRNAPGQVRALLETHLADSLTFYRSQYGRLGATLGKEGEIPETLFFLPLKDALVKISRELLAPTPVA